MTTPRIAGVDEAGRGPLAGPVIAAAVILGPLAISGLGDSKKIAEAERERLFDAINEQALAVGIGAADVAEIDALNIHHATLLAMRRAVEKLAIAPELALVDGKFCPDLACPSRAVVGGDGSVEAIGAASIVAKVSRDRIMSALDARYPAYGFARHKGYPTAAHMRALEQHGATPEHRRSYAPVRKVLEG